MHETVADTGCSASQLTYSPRQHQIETYGDKLPVDFFHNQARNFIQVSAVIWLPVEVLPRRFDDLCLAFGAFETRSSTFQCAAGFYVVRLKTIFDKLAGPPTPHRPNPPH